jgi:hypothetical protein
MHTWLASLCSYAFLRKELSKDGHAAVWHHAWCSSTTQRLLLIHAFMHQYINCFSRTPFCGQEIMICTERRYDLEKLLACGLPLLWLAVQFWVSGLCLLGVRKQMHTYSFFLDTKPLSSVECILAARETTRKWDTVICLRYEATCRIVLASKCAHTQRWRMHGIFADTCMRPSKCGCTEACASNGRRRLSPWLTTAMAILARGLNACYHAIIALSQKSVRMHRKVCLICTYIILCDCMYMNTCMNTEMMYILHHTNPTSYKLMNVPVVRISAW